MAAEPRHQLPDPLKLFAGLKLNSEKTLCVAVSGGGDSLALLLLLKNFLDRLECAPDLLALTVDHGLRPEAAAEARYVAQICSQFGITHRTLVWRTAKPRSGLAAAAREARMALLAQAARDAGAAVVMTGHTKDDQAETVAMRSARGTGRGEAGMAPATLYEGQVWFVRPTLNCRRADLRNFLSQQNIRWIDDPSNEDPSFERVRIRQSLNEDAASQYAERAHMAASIRRHQGEAAADLIRRYVQRDRPGLYRIDPALLEVEQHQARLYAIRILCAMAGGAEHLPDQENAERLVDALRRKRCATLSRAVIDPRRSGIFLYRENRNLPRYLLNDQPFLWDGRYWLSAKAGTAEIAVSGSPCHRHSADGNEILDRKTAPAAPQDVASTAFIGEPAVWMGSEYLGQAAQHPDIICRPAPAPWARLLPSFDLAPAAAICTLLACPPPPEPPIRHQHDTIE